MHSHKVEISVLHAAQHTRNQVWEQKSALGQLRGGAMPWQHEARVSKALKIGASRAECKPVPRASVFHGKRLMGSSGAV